MIGRHSPRWRPVPPHALHVLRQWLLVAAGILCVALGIVGALVPLLPTTVFLLLASACFVRSSARMHRWLLENRMFGKYLRHYRDGAGLPPAAKVTTLVLLWAALATSALLAVPTNAWWTKGLLFVVGLGVTIHILRLKSPRPLQPSECSQPARSRGKRASVF